MNQLPPASLEYCQLPSVSALAVFPTTAIPPRLLSASGSLNWPANINETASPEGDAVSSSTAVRLPLPRLGASFTAVMLIVTLFVPCSELPSPLSPGSLPTFPASLTVTVTMA